MVVVIAETCEQIVLVVDLYVASEIEQPSFVRAAVGCVERLGECRTKQGAQSASADKRADRGSLVKPFKVPEEPCFVLLNRPANGSTPLISSEEGVKGLSRSEEGRKRGDLMIAEVKKPVSVEFVSSGPRNYVDRSDRGNAGREIEVEGRDLKFLNCLGREVLAGIPGHRIEDAASVHRQPGKRGRTAAN